MAQLYNTAILIATWNKKVENATAVIWKMLMLAAQRFRKLNAPEKLVGVYLGFGKKPMDLPVEIKREEALVCA